MSDHILPHLPPSRSCYVRGCRCDECCDARRDYDEKRRRRSGVEPQKNWRHGTAYAYAVRGCRCSACTEANRVSHARWKEGVVSRGDGPFVHGASGYGNYGCRCEVCCAGHRARLRRGYERRRQRALAGDPAVPHGTESGYSSWSCRCDACRVAGVGAQRTRRQRRAV